MGIASKQRLVKLVGAVLALLLAVVGWFFLISPQRSHTASVNDAIAAAELNNQGVQARINQLSGDNTLLQRVKAQLGQAQLALPADSGLPAFLQSMQRIGNATTTQVTSLSVGQPTSLAPAMAVAPSSSSETSATPAPAPSTSTDSGAAGGAWALPIDAQVSGSPGSLNAFLAQLQSVQPRAVLITQVSRSVAGHGAPATLQLSMQAYVVPPVSTATGSAAATASAAPTAQAAAGS